MVVNCLSLHWKWSFPLRISSVSVTKISSFLAIWSNLLKKSIMENLIFCVVSAFSHDNIQTSRFLFDYDFYRNQRINKQRKRKSQLSLKDKAVQEAWSLKKSTALILLLRYSSSKNFYHKLSWRFLKEKVIRHRSKAVNYYHKKTPF